MAIKVLATGECRNDGMESRTERTALSPTPLLTVTDYSDPDHETEKSVANDYFYENKPDAILPEAAPPVHILVRCGAFKDRKRGRMRS